MKNYMMKHGLLIGIISIFIAIFVVGGVFSSYMTSQIDVHKEERETAKLNEMFLGMFTNATSVEAFETTSVSKEYELNYGRGTYSPLLVGSYKIYQNQTLIGVVYVVDTKGRESGLVVAYAVTIASNTNVGVKVISHKETPSYFNILTSTFYSQFTNKPFEDIGLSVDSVAGATQSAAGFEIGLDFARLQYAKDFNFEIPSFLMTLNSLTYNYDPVSFVQKPFIADVTYGEEDIQVQVYLANDFSYVGLVNESDDEPSDEAKAAIKSFASKSNLVTSSAGFVSYDESTRTLVVRSRGYDSFPIQVTLILNEAKTGVASYTVVTFESYEYSFGYDQTYGGAPGLENYFMNRYINGQPFDAVAGATITSVAMILITELVDGFIQSMNGGN